MVWDLRGSVIFFRLVLCFFFLSKAGVQRGVVHIGLGVSVFTLVSSVSLVGREAVAVRRLRCVLTISRFQRFTGTTRCYQIARPALDTVVRGLRSRLKIGLFSHDVAPIYPATVNGGILRRTHGVLSRIVYIGRVVDRRRRSLSNAFQLTILPAVTPCLLPHFFPRLVRGCPSLSVQIVRVGAPSVHGTLLANRTSTTVVTDVLSSTTLARRALFCRRFLNCISGGRPLFGRSIVHASSIAKRQL